ASPPGFSSAAAPRARRPTPPPPGTNPCAASAPATRRYRRCRPGRRTVDRIAPCQKGWRWLIHFHRAGRICASPLLSTRTVRPLIGWSRMATLDVHELEPLLQRALAEDGQAFNELLARLRRYMHAQVRKQLGAGADGPIDTSAIVQSVCRKVFVH